MKLYYENAYLREQYNECIHYGNIIFTKDYTRLNSFIRDIRIEYKDSMYDFRLQDGVVISMNKEVK